MKNLLCLILSFCCVCCSLFFAGCNSNSPSPELEASLESSTLSQDQIIISTSKNAKTISFDENSPEILTFLGSAPHKTYVVTIFGVLYKNTIKNKLVPIKADGSHYQTTEDPELINGYIDYFTLKLKLLASETSIKLSPSGESEPINKLRMIDGYYYLNLVWLKLNKEKTTFSLNEYEPENYIYIETLDPYQKTIQKLLVKLVYIVTFI